jgi:hypothetical protein
MGHVTWGDQLLSEMSDRDLRRWCLAQAKGYRPQAKTLDVWIAILRAFDDIGTPMTVRQMFYALVSRALIPKTEPGYDQVGYHLLNMRRGSVIPYRFLADNTRWMRKPRSYRSLRDFLQANQALYRKAIWADLPARVEIWIEKDALAGVVNEVTEPWDVPLMVTRGFPSETFVYEAVEAIKAGKKPTYVYYFGDFDPSGMAIATGLAAKMRAWTDLVTFTHVAVQPEHIRAWDLPTRPTKKTDSRAKHWHAASVELDAIPADRLRQLVRDCIEQHVPEGHLHAIHLAEQAERDTLEVLAASWEA